jgi:hypothetical protein
MFEGQSQSTEGSLPLVFPTDWSQRCTHGVHGTHSSKHDGVTRTAGPNNEEGFAVTVHDPKVLKDRLEQLAEELPFEVTTRPMMGGYIGYADDGRSSRLNRWPRCEAALSRPGAGAPSAGSGEDAPLARTA